MASLSLQHIAEILSSQSELVEPDSIVNYLLLDSRKYHSHSDSLFFALRGENHDGHAYLFDLYKKGLRNFVVEEIPEAEMPESNFILVNDSLEALQVLAACIRQEYLDQVIAITGSNGKTIVKEWLFQILHHHYKVVKSPKSYNSQIGVPLSVWRADEEDVLGIFEAGISLPGEMAKLEKILKPQIGIFTNIGSAHDQFFEDRSQKIKEKLKLFVEVQSIIFCADHTSIYQEISQDSNLASKRLINWSFEKREASLFIKNKTLLSDRTDLIGVFQNEELALTIPFTDSSSIENAIHCWLCCLELGLTTDVLRDAFLQLQSVEMRLEMKSGASGSILINDFYNSDLESLSVALDFMDQQSQKRQRVLILSDILQSGLDSKELYSKVRRILDRYELETCIGIGPKIMESDLPKGTGLVPYQDTDTFLADIHRYDWNNKALLLKGARKFQFERISRKLELKTHETVLEIHLLRMVENLNYYRAKLNPGVKTMAMVKAFSYGSGSYEIASLLEFHKVDYLAVAYTDEGVELRKAGISLPIMVLNAEPSSLTDVIDYELEPEIYSFRLLDIFQDSLRQKGVEKGFPIHIKMDTGMRRLGFQQDEIQELGQRLKSSESIKVASVFSHLAASDDPDHTEFTLGQIDLFQSMADQLNELLSYQTDRHILNSSGISNFPKAQFSMVRLGIGLYGISPDSNERKSLSPVNELRATVSQVKIVEAGDTVGYGLSFKADRKMKIATITLGYADGLRRSLSNGIGRVWINGDYYSIIGRVCMDMTMIDISHSDVKEGDEVEIIGPHIDVYELAQKMETIPYEVLTGISQRVKRIYFLE